MLESIAITAALYLFKTIFKLTNGVGHNLDHSLFHHADGTPENLEECCSDLAHYAEAGIGGLYSISLVGVVFNHFLRQEEHEMSNDELYRNIKKQFNLNEKKLNLLRSEMNRWFNSIHDRLNQFNEYTVTARLDSAMINFFENSKTDSSQLSISNCFHDLYSFKEHLSKHYISRGAANRYYTTLWERMSSHIHSNYFKLYFDDWPSQQNQRYNPLTFTSALIKQYLSSPEEDKRLQIYGLFSLVLWDLRKQREARRLGRKQIRK